jgi:Domain of unknown function (DUF4247)
MRAGRTAALLVSVAVVLAGCGSDSDDDVRNHLDGAYDRQSTTGDTATYSSNDPVGTTTAAIVDAVQPAERRADGGSEYLRYDDDIVVVSAAPGGSSILVEDLDGRYRSGYYAFLGSGFRPGSPASGGDGGPGDGK